jgi:hypothetical protein
MNWRKIDHDIGQIASLTGEKVNEYKLLNGLKDRPKS